MPPFSGDTDDIYTSYSGRGGSVEDDDNSPPSSPTVSQSIYRRFRRSLFLNGNFEPCPGAQPLQIEEQHKPQKRVTFNLEKNESHRVLNKFEYSPRERSQTWFSLEELKQIKADSRAIVQAWQSGADWYCMRGLEVKQSEAYRLKRKQNKADIRFAVLTEQSKQKFATGKVDPYRLAMVSMDCSESSRDEAHQVGLADEHAASWDVMKTCKEEAQAELMAYDCTVTSLFLLAQSAYAH